MKTLSTTAKLILAAGTLLVMLGFALIAELGVSAGLVHHGVTVAGFDVSGLSLTELEETLEERGATLRETPACFAREEVFLCVNPADIGWRPEPGATARQAFRVGRAGLLGALGERLAAWGQGVNVPWEGGPRALQVTKLLDSWEELLADRGLVLDRATMRYKIRRAIVTYPRRTLRIPGR